MPKFEVTFSISAPTPTDGRMSHRAANLQNVKTIVEAFSIPVAAQMVKSQYGQYCIVHATHPR